MAYEPLYTMLSKYGNCMRLLKIKNTLKNRLFLQVKSGSILDILWAFLIKQLLHSRMLIWHDYSQLGATRLVVTLHRGYYTVKRRYEFYFRVAKQSLRNEHNEWVKYCFCHEKIKFISSSRRVMFFLLYRQNDIDKIIDFYQPKSNCDGSNLQYSNIRHCLQ